MRTILKNLVVGSLIVASATACADLEVVNQNDPDAGRALTTAGDLASLISGSYNAWFQGPMRYGGPGMFLSNQAFQHNAPWANAGMEQYGRLPRISIQNNVVDNYYGNVTRVWTRSYRAIAAVADGLKALEDPDIADELGSETVTQLRAFGKYVQGIAHGTVALMYDRGFVVDETTDLTGQQEFLGYMDLMDAAMGYFDEAISISSGASFTIPQDWMAAEVTSDQLVRLAHSWKARFMAQVARTPSERAALNWSSIISEVDAGITETYMMHYDWDADWDNDMAGYITWYSWSQLAYFMYGMADQSGNYQDWLALDLDKKSYELPSGDQVLIVTPDTRFPQGTTVAEQRADQGEYFMINYEGGMTGNTWKKPGRGKWRWSWYKHGFGRQLDYWYYGDFDQPAIQMAEMDLLKAEGLYRTGDMAGAAALINKTRTLHGLNATDANGTNTSCVPKLPDGSCGDLWEMLKWEKRMETVATGVAGVNWFWDGRGWGDLWKDTPLQFPVPCQELYVLEMLPCNTYGGPGGEMGAAVSTYSFPHEGG